MSRHKMAHLRDHWPGCDEVALETREKPLCTPVLGIAPIKGGYQPPGIS
jgi:hypothetical protein